MRPKFETGAQEIEFCWCAVDLFWWELGEFAQREFAPKRQHLSIGEDWEDWNGMPELDEE